jgi:hypothetical protein
LGLDCVYLNASGTGVENGGIDQHSTATECGKTQGYWVDGSVTNVTVGGDAETVSLTGTTNGSDQTQASYQQNSTATVGMFFNTPKNPADHIALGIGNGPLYGLNPRSDTQFLKYKFSPFGKKTGVPGAVKPQVGGFLDRSARIPITGMQAQMLQDAMGQSAANPPNYTIPSCSQAMDCATWVQMMLGDAGINTGPTTSVPNQLMNQIDDRYPQ